MAVGSEIEYDPEFGIAMLNDSDVSSDDIRQAILDQAPEVAVLRRWALGNQSSRHTIFDRDKYVRPDTIFDKFRLAQEAAETDDVVSNVIETTEQLAFKRIAIECEDEDEENIWFQIADDINLPERMREIWRELFAISQAYPAVLFERKTLKVKGKSEKGTKRKKQFRNILVPSGITLLDPLKVIPVGNFMFNKEQLAYIADIEEAERFDETLAGANSSDLIISQLITGKYEFSDDKRGRAELEKLGEITGRSDLRDRLFLLNPDRCWRITATRPQYKRFAHVRMESVFELLDLKHLLREMDRALLLGSPLRNDESVVTETGFKPIGDVEVGDKIFAPDGTLTEVQGVFPQGYLPMYKVSFSDHTHVYCDASHHWTVRTPGGQWRTIPLSQIMEEGLTQPNGRGKNGNPQIRYRHEIPMQSCIELPAQNLPIDPYLLGYLLGDGCFKSSTPKVSSSEAPDLPWIECLPEKVRATPNPSCPEFSLGKVPQGRQPSGQGDRENPLTRALRSLGLFGVDGPDKFIPEQYLWSSVEQRFALLQGLFDSDGTCRAVHPEFSNGSEKLVDGVVQIVQSLGGLAYKRKWTKAEMWTVEVYLPQDRPPFRLKRKAQAWTQHKRQNRRKIVKVERSLAAEATCIKVDREDGLFLTSSFIATHNTNAIILVKRGDDKRPAKQHEINQLTDYIKTTSRIPIIVSDHRIEIEIITPKNDKILATERYNGLDSRITSRLYQILSSGNYSSGTATDDSIKLLRVIASSMEARRDQIRDSIMTHVFKPAYLQNDAFTTEPKMAFYPRRIALDFDNNIAVFIQTLRDRGDISRETILAELDIIQEDEAYKRRREAEKFDKDFPPTNVPFDSPNKQGPGGSDPAPTQKDGVTPKTGDPKTDGRTGGGTKNGGGKNPESTRPNPSKT